MPSSTGWSSARCRPSERPVRYNRALHDYPQRRNRAPPHLCDHLPPGRRQDHADREAAAVRWRDPDGRRSQGSQGRASRDLGLDAPRAGAWHFRDLVSHAVPVPRPRDQPARHAGPRGFLRGHLPDADRGRFGADGDRLRARSRGTHDPADGSVPVARHADHDLRQQARPRGTPAGANCSTRSSGSWASPARR